MSEELLVCHCAPTLAGIKTGNLFSCACASRSEVMSGVRSMNRRLSGKGICVLPLRFQSGRVLLYVFRPKRLSRDLTEVQARRILTERGYAVEQPVKCIRRLMERLGEGEDFPHEIGLFLGYPPEDVAGFIQNHAEGCKFTGCWKVYGDEERARMIFNRFKKCSQAYYEIWQKERSIERLTVAV